MYWLYEREKIELESAICYEWRAKNPLGCIILVHGLGGNVKSTWRNFPFLLMGSAFAQNKDLIIYSYRSSAFIPTGKSFNDLSHEFATFLESLITKYESFYFVSHSLGSVLSMQVMLDLYARGNIWGQKIKAHVMLAPAIWGSLFAKFSFNQVTRMLATRSVTLEGLRQEWGVISNCVKCKSFVLFGTEDKIIQGNRCGYENLNMTLCRVSETHASIPKGNSLNQAVYRSILNCLYQASGSSPYDSREFIKNIVFESDKSEWEYDDRLAEFIYKPNLKLRIMQFDARGSASSFNEPWVNNFPDQNAVLINYAIFYDNHRVEDFPMISCDGGRYLIPIPKSRFELTITREQYKQAKIMEDSGMYGDLNQGLNIARITVN
jgi:hypothetical protein